MCRKHLVSKCFRQDEKIYLEKFPHLGALLTSRTETSSNWQSKLKIVIQMRIMTDIVHVLNELGEILHRKIFDKFALFMTSQIHTEAPDFMCLSHFSGYSKISQKCVRNIFRISVNYYSQ